MNSEISRQYDVTAGRFHDLCDVAGLNRELRAGKESLPVLQQALRSGNARLKKNFEQGCPPEDIVYGRAWLVDQLLGLAWRQIFPEPEGVGALVAVGGYGRGELHPYSDIDLLLLLSEEDAGPPANAIESFLTLLWDIGLEVGHSVRTLDQCVEEARKDVTVITNLIEARRLAGNRTLFDEMERRLGPDKVWPSAEFFAAKQKEQRLRHHKFHDTAYKLEPNVKESPGGLRDVQTVIWVTLRHFGTGSLAQLVDKGFLTDDEFRILTEGRSFLWQIRNALHFLNGRQDDRLLFDHQHSIARQLGYREPETNQAVEALMKHYYRMVMELSRLNEMLLQHFQEAILWSDRPTETLPINPRFQAVNHFLEVRDEDIFERFPYALLELFLLLEQHPDIHGVRASTIRQVRGHLHLIDEEFRSSPAVKGVFLEILKQPAGVTDALRRMNQYGVLAAYLPVFGRIVGQMQFDLIHLYTVDEHTLFLIRNLRRFTVPEFADEFPLCSQLIKTFPEPELLYIAGLFHDIAKGRGGDHSDLGAADAREFCMQHGLSEYDTSLVTWLVMNHLMMSTTAQRRDTNDPEVIQEFARAVANMRRLDALYLLTVADIRATSPELWNAWKDSLLIQLYNETKRTLRRGLDLPVDRHQHVLDVQDSARRQLMKQGIDPARIDAIWSHFEEEYFARCTPDEVAWHTFAIASRAELPKVLVEIRTDTSRNGTGILVYGQTGTGLFAPTTMVLEQLGLSIADARKIQFDTGYSMDTYLVLDESGEPVTQTYHIEEIRHTLERVLQSPEKFPARVSRRTASYLKYFEVPTRVFFSEDASGQRTVIELVTTDRPGLLATIAKIFIEHGVTLHNARIGTFGSRAEDVFYVTGKDGKPLQDTAARERLKDAIVQGLGGDSAA